MDEPETQTGSPPPIPDTASVAPPAPWGYWATIGWTILIVLGYVLAQAVGMILYLAWNSAVGGGRLSHREDIENSGLVLALATLCSAPVAVGLSLFFAWLRRGMSVREYLGLRWPGWRTAARWCLFLFAFIAVSDLTTTLILRRPLVPEIMVDMYASAGILPLLWFAMIFAGPMAEEFIFRGFFFTGLRGRGLSPVANVSAILATAAPWAIIHFQYDAFGIGVIFVCGILLGLARLKTDSLPLCILLHMLNNFVSTVETAIVSGSPQS
jgi:CAAX protease family protein